MIIQDITRLTALLIISDKVQLFTLHLMLFTFPHTFLSPHDISIESSLAPYISLHNT